MNRDERILQLLESHGEMLRRMDHGMGRMEERMDHIERHMAQIDSRMDRIEESAGQIEGRVGRQEGQIGRLDERSQRTAVLLETEVDRKLSLLYEGHGVIVNTLDSLASKNRAEVLENDVALLKDAVRLMRQEITELKKAQ